MGKVHRNSLKPGHKLHWYEIKRILGQGGFGITYLAHDINLDEDVAIKEYLPIELSVRTGDDSVHPISEDHNDKFTWGLDRFVQEARTLSRFKHPNVVRVRNVFEDNNTAYMVMEYEKGESLQELLVRRKTLEEAELLNILIPLLGGLALVHEQGFIHRDIKPANIFMREDGSPVLLDFGSARQALGEETKTLTSLVSPGYAPFEQYYSKSDEQGPWTDIYGMAATLYRAITGRAPLDAVDRSKAILNTSRDTFVLLQDIAKDQYSERFLRAVDHGLNFKQTDRPATVKDWQREFEIPTSMPTPEASEIETQIAPENRQAAAPPRQSAVETTDPEAEGQRDKKSGRLKFALPLLLLLGGGALYSQPQLWQPYLSPSETQTTKVDPELVRMQAELRRLKEEKEQAKAASEKAAEQARLQAEIDQQKEELAKAEAERVAAEQARTRELEQQRQQAAEEQRQAEEQQRLAAEEEAKQKQLAEARQAEIDQLLSSAEQDIAALRLTSPPGNNALDKYQSVLALEPDHPQAQAGLTAIVVKYIALAKQAAESGQFDRALAHLNRAEGITPEAENIGFVREEIEVQQAREAEAARLAEEKRRVEQARQAEAERQRLVGQKAEEKSRAEQARQEEAERQRLAAEKARAADASLVVEMVDIPAGSFRMGSNDGNKYEKPVHSVRIPTFRMGKYEVTQAQWKKVMGENPSRFKDCGANCPVEKVSWDDVQQFIRKLNQHTGGGYRLPSEAEWEYACRSGGQEEIYCGGNSPDSLAWYDGNSGDKTSYPVGQKRANGLGLYDMSGNVGEWTQDCWNVSYQGAPTDGSAWTAGDCSKRVWRGGSWYFFPALISSADRFWYTTSVRRPNMGFRLAQDQ